MWVVLLISCRVPAAREPDTGTGQVQQDSSSVPLHFSFGLSHFIRNASCHFEKVLSFYFCLILSSL